MARYNIKSLNQIDLKNRNCEVDYQRIQDLYNQYHQLSFDLSQLQKDRNANSKLIPSEIQKSKGKSLKLEIMQKQLELNQLESTILPLVQQLPNATHPSTPIGDESNAKVIKTIGKPRLPCGNQPFKDHMELCHMHDMVDFERGGKVCSSSFYFLKNAGALLEMALSRYAFDVCIQRGFTPVIVPDIIRHDLIQNCGFLPKSQDPQTFFVSHHDSLTSSDKPKFCLAATAEFPMAGMYSNEVLPQVPIKMVGFGRAFRAEGNAGSQNRGK